MKNLIVILFSIFSFQLFSQEIRDGVYNRHIADREFLPYQKIREADVFWSKRLWRIIDVREKQNLIFSYPQLPLIDILHTAALNEEIRAFDNTVIDGDQFKSQLTKEQVSVIGVKDDTMWTQNIYTGLQEPIYIHEELDFTKVTKYKVKEDWFFNSATSTMEVRIIGIAPLMAVFDDDGNYLGDETLYWLYYPELRPILAKYEAYNPGNNAMRLSWDDIFVARFFASYIYKEDNVYDRNIQEYATGMDALFESERIKEAVFNFEHDLWSY